MADQRNGALTWEWDGQAGLSFKAQKASLKFDNCGWSLPKNSIVTCGSLCNGGSPAMQQHRVGNSKPCSQLAH